MSDVTERVLPTNQIIQLVRNWSELFGFADEQSRLWLQQATAQAQEEAGCTGPAETMTESQLTQLEEKISEFAAIRFPNPYWFDGLPDNLYCRKCAQAIEAEHPDWQLDGGWLLESDFFIVCSTCGGGLEHSLTDEGIKREMNDVTFWEQEIDDWEDSDGVDFSGTATRYALSNISQGYPLQNAKWLHGIIFGEHETKKETTK